MSLGSDIRTAVVVDQHPLWLDTVEQVVRRAGIEVAAKLTRASEAHDRIAELRPELLVTGIRMAEDDMDGLALVRAAGELVPGIRTIVLSMYEDAYHVDGAFAAGAHAYVLKTAHPDDLTSAVRQVFDHSVFLPGAGRPPAADKTPLLADSPGLTRREKEILQLVAEGHSNAELARMLWVTEQTVKFHLSNIYRKLGVSNRTEASRWAQLQGMLPSAGRLAAA
jgi:DNA-binding NarL/FixJ family response regulator